ENSLEVTIIWQSLDNKLMKTVANVLHVYAERLVPFEIAPVGRVFRYDSRNPTDLAGSNRGYDLSILL
ncbi:hypothetical protein, partial [Mammaliicoccus sciuri]|uniref:hypothetical protein n=1 Tax=Mammaliicoccus sciuri TaxID=1296 RepID=UPI001F10D5D9